MRSDSGIQRRAEPAAALPARAPRRFIYLFNYEVSLRPVHDSHALQLQVEDGRLSAQRCDNLEEYWSLRVSILYHKYSIETEVQGRPQPVLMTGHVTF